jgi:DNA-binding response OmpR family regulator
MDRIKTRVPDTADTLHSARVLLVQNRSEDPSGLHNALKRDGFEVITISSVRDALKVLATEPFSALICDLHLPTACDGFTLVNAVRHIHPDAITMIVSDYPALRESVADLLPQADEVLVTPIPPQEIVKLLKTRLLDPKHRIPSPPQPVALVLEKNALNTIKEWLKRVKDSKELGRVILSDTARTGHLRTLLNELIARLRTPHLDEGHAIVSKAAVAHGRILKDQGYTAAMLVEESRILQVCIFKTLRNNLSAVDLALVLTDVMTIANEVDSQLTQTIASFSAPLARRKAVAS